MTRIRLVALAAVALVGLGACSSDSTSSSNEITLPGGTLPGGGTLPNLDTLPDSSIPDISLPDELLPENLTEECRAIAVQFGLLMSQAFAPAGEQSDLNEVFGDISSKVPEELRADVLVLGEAFATYAEVLKAANNDFTNAEVQAALEALDTPEVNAANERLSAYFDATCPDV